MRAMIRSSRGTPMEAVWRGTSSRRRASRIRWRAGAGARATARRAGTQRCARATHSSTAAARTGGGLPVIPRPGRCTPTRQPPRAIALDCARLRADCGVRASAHPSQKDLGCAASPSRCAGEWVSGCATARVARARRCSRPSTPTPLTGMGASKRKATPWCAARECRALLTSGSPTRWAQ